VNHISILVDFVALLGVRRHPVDSIATADLIELVFIQREAIDLQLQFWLTATFALVAASYIAGHNLGGVYRILIGVLYLITTAMLMTRWDHLGDEIFVMYEELASRGAPIDPPIISASIRVLLILFGTGVAITFLMRDHSRKKSGTS
jgi:hypothetical protein